MDFEKGLVGSILREGFDEYVKLDVDSRVLGPQAKIAIGFIKDHWNTYQKLPSPDVLKASLGTDFTSSIQEPMGFWADHLVRKYLHANATEISQNITEMIANGEDVHKIYSLVKSVVEIYDSVSSGSSKLHSLFDEASFDEYIDSIWGGVTSIMTPWPQLNEKLSGGWKPGDLAVIAARPGQGKTFALLLSCLSAWRQGKKVLVITTEMSMIAIQLRFMWLAGLYHSLGKLRRGMFDRNTREWIKSQIRDLHTKGEAQRVMMMGNDFDTQIETIESKVISFKPDLLAIDGAYLLKSREIHEKDKFRRVAEIFDRLKMMSKKYQIATLTTTQLNRGGPKQKNQKLDLERMAFADNIGMVADYLFFMVQDDNMKQERKMRFEPGKLREAEDYSDLNVNWDFENSNFTELPKPQDSGSLGGSKSLADSFMPTKMKKDFDKEKRQDARRNQFKDSSD